MAYASLSAYQTANPGREAQSVERVGGTAHPYFVDYPARNFLQNPASTDVWGRGAALPSEVLKAIYWPQTAPAQPSARIGAVEWRNKPSAPCGPAAPVYHRRNPASGTHLYTTSLEEANNAATQYNYTEDLGIAFKAETGASTGHYYTASVSEKNTLVATGWTDEGIKFYAGSP